MFSTILLTLEHIHVTFEGKVKRFWRKVICKQSKLRVKLILHRVDSLICTPQKYATQKIRPNFLSSTSLLYKILPTSLGTCNPTFYTFYTSHLRWNSTMRRCFYHTDLGQNAVFHNFVIQIALTQYSGRSKHLWAFSETVKKFLKSPIRLAGSQRQSRLLKLWLIELYAST